MLDYDMYVLLLTHFFIDRKRFSEQLMVDICGSCFVVFLVVASFNNFFTLDSLDRFVEYIKFYMKVISGKRIKENAYSR